MGVIKRQSIKQSLANYFGVILGAISTLFIFPLAVEANGLLRFIVATATLALPFVSLGVNSLTVRFFPEFENKKNGHNGLLGLGLVIVFIGFLVFLAIAFAFREVIFDFYSRKTEDVYVRYIPFVIPLVLMLAINQLLKFYTSNFHRVVIPFIINELSLKIAFPVLILLLVGEWIGLNGMVWGLIIVYLIIVLMSWAYLALLGELKVNFNFSGLLKGDLFRQMRSFGLYSMLGSVGGVLAFQIDVFMVGSIQTMYATGIYTMSLFIANTIDVPSRALFSIAAPIVSKAWKDNNLKEIQNLYTKSSINLFVIGAFFFLIIWLNLDDLFAILPKGDILGQGKYVVFFIAMAKLIDQLTGINNFIINYSKYFRFNFYAIVILSVLNITLNLILIPRYPITGAAIATMISLSAYNFLKLAYLHFKFKMQPFSRKTLWALALASGCYLLVLVIPSSPFPLLNMVIRSVVLLAVYGSLTLYLDLSPDITHLVKENWGKVKRKFL